MKTNRMIWNIGRYMCLALLVAFVACTRDEFAENTTVQYEKGLCFSLYADGDMQLAGTRTAGEDALNENRISTVDIFLFMNDGSLNAGGYAHAEVTTSDEVVYLYKGSEWLDNFNEQDGPYTVYALANYKGDTQLSNVQSLDDLKAVVAKDVDVVKWEGMGDPAYEGKTFLMDGKQTVTYAELQSAQNSGQPYVANVPVSRAAVKIELTLKFSDDWAPKFMATGLEAQLSNYASITPALAEGNPLDGDQRGLSNYPGLSGDAVDNFSSAPVSFKPETTYNGSKIRFYTYVNRWDDFINNETMLLIDLPGRYDEKGYPGTDNPDAEVLTHNFYKVPIINNAERQEFQRNTFYQITATVDMKGTETVDVPVELTNVQFKTAPWDDDVINVGEGDTPSYLVLSESHVDIRNADGYNELEFYSSSPITSVTIVGFPSQDKATAAGVDFIYPGDGTTIPGAFFVNKDNVRKEVELDDPNGDDSRWDSSTYDDKISVDWDKNVTSGKIYLTSTNPENVTKRYITLAVTNEVGTRYVVVEQYPLEYIQPIAGYYSYRDDFISDDDWEPSNVPCTWKSSFTTSKWFPSALPTSNSIFSSKVYLNGKIYTYSFSDGKPQRSNRSEGTTNNKMYFVTITQTDDAYTLARPILDSNGYTLGTPENTEYVSPTFMLASRLGTVSAMSYSNAQIHCQKYVEVTMDGVVLDDWRLPTRKELEIIQQYQITTPDVMDEVLALSYRGDVTRYWGAGGYYRTAYGGASDPVGEWTSSTSTNSSVWARCVRDVKPTDAFLQSNN